MPNNTDFSESSVAKVKSLAYEETRKHALDRLEGVSIGTVIHIMKKCKRVNMSIHRQAIHDSLNTAVRQG